MNTESVKVIDMDQAPLTSASMNNVKSRVQGGGHIYLSVVAFNLLTQQGYAAKQYDSRDAYETALADPNRQSAQRTLGKHGERFADGDWVYHLEDDWPSDVVWVHGGGVRMVAYNFAL